MTIAALMLSTLLATVFGEWPGEWKLYERADRPNRVEKTADGIRLNGTIGTKRVPRTSKLYKVTVKARGEGGWVKPYVSQYTYATEKRSHQCAWPLEARTGKDFQEYTDFFEIPLWHPISHLEFYLDGENVEIAEARCEPVQVAESAKKRERPVLTVPLAGEPFVFDGVFRREWFNRWGVTIANGYRDLYSHRNYHRQSETCFGSDGENLYIAVLHPIPPGGVVCNCRERDGNVWTDDSVELWVNPIAANERPSHAYQLISNFRGVIYDMDNDFGIGQFDKDWSCAGFEAKRGTMAKPEKNRDDYILIIKLPLKSVGVRDPSVPFGMTVGRNFANPQEFADLHGGGYKAWTEQLQVSVKAGAPAVRLAVNDLCGDGKYAVALRTSAGAGSATLELKEPAKKVEKPLGEDVVLDLRNRVLANAVFEAVVKDAQGGILFRGGYDLDMTTYSPKSARLAFASKYKSLVVEHFPFQKLLVFRWTGMSAAEKAALKGATVTLTAPDGTAQELRTEQIDIQDNMAVIRFPFDVQDRYGDWKVDGAAVDKDGQVLAKAKDTFPWKKLEWLGNDLGKDEVVVKPYTALEVKSEKGKSKSEDGGSGVGVTCLLREHWFGENGLPRSVVAAGEKVLAAPMEFVVEVADGADGVRTLPLKSSKFKLLKQSDTRVEFAAGLTYPDLQVQLKAWMEYDGLIWYTMKLEGKAQVRRFSLKIPYAKAHLFHFSNGNIRGDRMYYDLSTELPGTGLVWEGRQALSHKTRKNTFLPFFWLGNNHRGLMWCAETDRGWKHDGKGSGHRLFRDANGTLTMMIDFIDAGGVPVTLTPARTMEFGLLANPFKPVAVAPETGLSWSSSIGCGCMNVEPWILDPFFAGQIITKDPKTAFVFYLAGQEYPKGDSEMKYVYPEIARYPRGAYTLALPHRKYKLAGFDSDNYLYIHYRWTPEFIDLLLWRMNASMKSNDVDGLYMDNSYISFSDEDLKTRNPAYNDDDGVRRPGCDLLGMREAFKRVSVLAQKYGKRKPGIIVHNTGCQVLPKYTFADLAFGGEMSIANDAGDHFNVFDSAWTETMLGVDWGFARGMLTMLHSRPADVQRRQTLAMFANFGIYDYKVWPNGQDPKVEGARRTALKDFGVNAADCKFVLWRENQVLVPSDKAVRVSYYERGSKRLFCCGNQSADAKRITFTLPPGTLTDAMSAETLAPSADGTYTIDFAGHDFKMLKWMKK